MVKQEKIDFEELTSLFENKGETVDLSDEEILNAVRNPDIISDMDKSDQIIFIAKMMVKLSESPELRDKYKVIIRAKGKGFLR